MPKQGAALAAAKRRLEEVDGDDDQAVERAKASLASAEARQLDASLLAAGGSDAAILAQLDADLVRVRANIAAGEAHYAVASARLSLSLPLSGRGACTVIAVYPMGAEASKDFELLSSICSDDGMCAMSDKLAALVPRFSAPALAMEALVASHPATSKLPAPQRAALASKFAVWLGGVPWSKCSLSATHRPSLASWEGMPWEEDSVAQRCLTRGLASPSGRLRILVMSEGEMLMATRNPEWGTPFPLTGSSARAALEAALGKAAKEEQEEAAAKAALDKKKAEDAEKRAAKKRAKLESLVKAAAAGGAGAAAAAPGAAAAAPVAAPALAPASWSEDFEITSCWFSKLSEAECRALAGAAKIPFAAQRSGKELVLELFRCKAVRGSLARPHLLLSRVYGMPCSPPPPLPHPPRAPRFPASLSCRAGTGALSAGLAQPRF